MQTNILQVSTAHSTQHTKASLIAALHKFVNRKPGLDYANYGSAIAYRAEVRAIGKQLQTARTLLRAVELSGGVTLEAMREALRPSGRLSLLSNGELEYCAGQYYATEYRASVCGLCSSLLWNAIREAYPHFDGTELRAYFRRYFGKGIQSRWFN